MSKAVLQGNASGTGVVTLQTPNTNTDRTITLPDADGTVVIANGSGYITAPSNPAFTAQINGNSDATYSSGSNIPFNITGYNRGSNFNTSTYAFTAPVAGVYLFSAALYLTSSSGFTSNYQFGIVKNGSFPTFGGLDNVAVANASPNGNGGTVEATVTVVLNLAVGDTVAVQPRSASLRVYQGHCYFTGCLIG